MLNAFSRSELLLGKSSLATLSNCRVAVFGIGGVGTYAVEGLARTGVGKFLLIDDDLICLTNLNRQIHATRKTIGKSKAEVMRERILDINPKAQVDIMTRFYQAGLNNGRKSTEPVEGSMEWSDLYDYHTKEGKHIDYIVDAIDTVSSKIDLVVNASVAGIPIISSMGVGNKLDPTKLEVADIFETSVCPLARVIRKELKARKIKSLKVIYSREEPIKPIIDETNSCDKNCVCPKDAVRTCSSRRSVPGSVAYMPSVAGMIIAGEVIKDLIN